MADFTFNIALGRVAQYAQAAVDTPSTNKLSARILKTVTAPPTDQNLRDAKTFAQVLSITAGGTNPYLEADFTNYAKKILANVAVLINDTDSAGTAGLSGVDANSVAVDCDDWSYASAGGATNNSTAKMIICAEPGSGPTNANTIPLVSFDYAETTTGSTLNILVPTGGFWSAADV